MPPQHAPPSWELVSGGRRLDGDGGGYASGQDGEATLGSMGGIKMGKNHVRKKMGLLYDRLIVQPDPKYSAYYQMVKQIIEEMKAEFPHEDCYDFGDKRYEEWFKKWFGVDEKDE